MNNLKRVLALGLSGTMLTGMMMMGAGAVGVTDFTDGSEITNQEAVTTMAALGVILGKDTGAFDPTGNVTRAEMAKMITVMLNGGKDPVLGTKAVPTYTDIDNHWAESYIEYCTTQGVISGQGDGTFNPDGSVTGSQAAKMALAALGYDSAAYNFTGIDWEVNTNRIANADADLYDGLAGLDPSQPINRDNAAQMLYNTLDARTKKMTPTTSTNGSIEYTYTDGGSFMQEKFNAVKVEGVVVGNEIASFGGTHLDANRTRITVTNFGTGNGEQNSFGNAAKTGNLTVQATTGLDELGRSVSVYVKTGSSASRAEIMGDVIMSEDNAVITDYSGDSINDVRDDNNLNFASAGDKTSLENSATQVVTNYGTVANYTSHNGVRGEEKILIDNDDDGVLDYVLLNTYRLGRVTSYVTTGDGAITINAGSGNTLSASDKKDVIGFDDVARNDYVLAASIGGRIHVEKAETVTGELTGYRTSTDTNNVLGGGSSATYSNRLAVDGENHNVAWFTGFTGGADNIQPAYNYGSTYLNNEGTFYMGKGGYVLAVGDSEESSYSYALVLAGGNGVTNQVRVALSNGTKATYTIASNGQQYNKTGTVGSIAPGGTAETFTVGDLCSYTLSSNGTIRLTKLTNASYTNYTNASFTKGRTGITGTEGTSYAAANTAFFYTDNALSSYNDSTPIPNGDVDIYSGYANAPSITASTARVYTNAAGRVVAVLLDNATTTANVDDLVFVYGTGNSNNDYTEVNAFVAGSPDRHSGDTALKVSSGLSGNGAYKYTIDSDGYYELTAVESQNYLKSTYDAGTNVGEAWGVFSSNSRTIVVGTWNAMTQEYSDNQIELDVTADTLFIDRNADLDDPVGEMGYAPSEGDRIEHVVFSRDAGQPDDAKLIVIRQQLGRGTVTNNNYTVNVPTITGESASNGYYRAAVSYKENFDSSGNYTNTTVTVTVTVVTAPSGTAPTVTLASSGASISQVLTFTNGVASHSFTVSANITDFDISFS